MVRILMCGLAAIAVVFGVSAGAVQAQEAPSAELCTQLVEFETAIIAINGDTVEEIQSQFDTAQAEFDELRQIAGDDYQVELDAMAQEMADFQAALTAAAESDPPDLLELADLAADLVIAAELLAEQIDCVGVADPAATTTTTPAATTTTSTTSTTTTTTTTTTSTTTTVVPTAVNTGSPLDSPLSLTLVAIALGGLVVTGGATLARRRV